MRLFLLTAFALFATYQLCWSKETPLLQRTTTSGYTDRDKWRRTDCNINGEKWWKELEYSARRPVPPAEKSSGPMKFTAKIKNFKQLVAAIKEAREGALKTGPMKEDAAQWNYWLPQYSNYTLAKRGSDNMENTSPAAANLIELIDLNCGVPGT